MPGQRIFVAFQAVFNPARAITQSREPEAQYTCSRRGVSDLVEPTFLKTAVHRNVVGIGDVVS